MARSKAIPRKVTLELASCVVFALKFLKAQGSGLIVQLTGPNRGQTQLWQDKFFDALEGLGIEYDREAYYKGKSKKQKKRNKKKD